MSFFSRHKREKDSPTPGQGDRVYQRPDNESNSRLSSRSGATNQATPVRSRDPSRDKATRDLWSEAFASLPTEDRDTLRPVGLNGTPVDAISHRVEVEKVMELTEEKYEAYCRRGWHTKKGDTSRETNVRIKAKEIMCSALQFKDIVDAGLKFDPSGYGTIVWGVLSGVLTLVQNDKEKADAVFDSAAVMARYLPRYAVIEDHYRSRPTQEQKAFENQIAQVYGAILKYAACVQKELNRSFAGIFLNDLFSCPSKAN